MCGIYGSINNTHPIEVLNKKLDSISYRGPDFKKLVQYDKVVLGHVRLAIVDLDERSNQPFEYNHLRIVFNGEIYNFNDLKCELISNGFAFATTSDTEVICASYLFWGENCVDKFNGMFSFVIYDTQKNILFGSRDRLGKKPFFYRCTNGTFEFCSQISPLILNNFLNLSQRNISNYLLWGHQPAEETVFEDVFKLQSGCWFKYNLDTYELDIVKYYSVNSQSNNLLDLSFSEAKEGLKNLLINATSIRLMASDVPVGVYLSGGVDSSVVTAIASEISKSKIKTFSIGFEEVNFDESKYAENIANLIGTNHTTFFCNYSEAKDLIINYENYIDEPFADPSTIPSLLLAKHTRDHVTVALTGDGGDEIFIGYKRYDWINTINKIYVLPFFFRKLISTLINLFPGKKMQVYSHVLQCGNLDELYLKLMTTFKKEWLLSPISVADNDFLYFLTQKVNLNNYEKYSDFDIKYYLNDDINTKVDRSSMRFSLEARNPLMDYRIYDFVKKLPTEYKVNYSDQKILLKSILGDYVNRDEFERPKSGFGMPLNIWFKSDLKDFVLDVLTNGDITKIECLNRAKIMNLVNDHFNGKNNNAIEIWRIIVLIKWLKKYYA